MIDRINSGIGLANEQKVFMRGWIGRQALMQWRHCNSGFTIWESGHKYLDGIDTICRELFGPRSRTYRQVESIIRMMHRRTANA